MIAGTDIISERVKFMKVLAIVGSASTTGYGGGAPLDILNAIRLLRDYVADGCSVSK